MRDVGDVAAQYGVFILLNCVNESICTVIAIQCTSSLRRRGMARSSGRSGSASKRDWESGRRSQSSRLAETTESESPGIVDHGHCTMTRPLLLTTRSTTAYTHE